MLFIDKHDLVAFSRQGDGGARSGGSRADDGYVEILHSQLVSEITAKTRNGNIDWMRSVPTSARRNSSLHSEIVHARCTESGASVRVIMLPVNPWVSKRMPW